MPVARNSDPETSWLAAYDASRRADSDRGIVHRALLSIKPEGLTDFQLASVTNLGDNARKRRSELKNAGLVADTGIRRLAPSGSWAIVWAAVTPAERRETFSGESVPVEHQGTLL